jgi:Holliday junction resolvase RusA-like endonuclease
MRKSRRARYREENHGRSIRFDVDPVPRPRMTHRDKWKQRPAVMTYFAYRDALSLLSMSEGWEPGEALRLTFVIPMTPSWSGAKKRRMAGTPHRQRPDLDNLIKGFGDSFGEDAQVWRIEAEKRWANEGEPGYVLAVNLEAAEAA